MERENNLKVLTEKGKLVGDYSIYEQLRQASIDSRWEYSAEMDKLYRRLDVMSERFMGRIATPYFSGEIPPVVLAIDDLRNNKTLAAYRLIEDEYGLNYKIIFNEAHYDTKERSKRWRFGEWAQSETELHELFHHKQQMLGKDPFTPRSKVTHNREFTEGMLRPVGLYCSPEGYHYKVADIDSPFGLMMRQWGIEPPEEGIRDTEYKIHWFKEGRPTPGRSTLAKLECPSCGLKVRYGKKDEPTLPHGECVTERLIALGRDDLLKAWGEIIEIGPLLVRG